MTEGVLTAMQDDDPLSVPEEPGNESPSARPEPHSMRGNRSDLCQEIRVDTVAHHADGIVITAAIDARDAVVPLFRGRVTDDRISPTPVGESRHVASAIGRVTAHLVFVARRADHRVATVEHSAVDHAVGAGVDHRVAAIRHDIRSGIGHAAVHPVVRTTAEEEETGRHDGGHVITRSYHHGTLLFL